MRTKTRSSSSSQRPRARPSRHEERILESYRALDALAAAVFQTGMTVFIGGVTIGLTVAKRYSELVIAGSFLSLVAAIFAALAMISTRDKPPDAGSLKDKDVAVRWATGILVLGILSVVIVFLLLLAITDAGSLLSLTQSGKSH
jgi:amino acid transporter